MKRKPANQRVPKAPSEQHVAGWRYGLLLGFWLVCALLLVLRAVDLQVFKFNFLNGEGDSRNMRIQPLSAHRGVISDRNGKPLAVSTPVTTLWANPQELMQHRDSWKKLAGNGVLSLADLKHEVLPRQHREFIYLKRRLPPATANKVLDLDIPGIYPLTEYRRYYPAGAVTSQVVGITGMNGEGQEGLELSYDKQLAGTAGKEKVIRDLYGRVVQVLSVLQPAKPGRDLTLSIDLRLQYAAYEALLKSVQKFDAKSGSVVVLDAKTGEVLAMVNQPTYNPNSHHNLVAANMRNRAATDSFEPGSTMKPFTVAAALEAGLVTPDTLVNTNPGYLRVDGFTIRDDRNFGLIDVTTILTKSSNVGASKLALSLNPHDLPRFFSQFGFGRDVKVNFPGASNGYLPVRTHWTDGERAALSYGYGVSVTTLQLAHAYATLANGGVMVPLSLLRVDKPPKGHRVIKAKVAHEVVDMLETVVSNRGTARRAKVPGFQMAGKTGTAHKSNAGGYAENHYVGIFAGMGPIPNPRYVTVVMINDPRQHSYFGGRVAAPVFAQVMATVMRDMQVDPSHPDLRYAGIPLKGGES